MERDVVEGAVDRVVDCGIDRSIDHTRAPVAPPRAIWRRLLDAASAPYRDAGSFASHYARGKLGIDPVFRYVITEGLIPSDARVLDLGCGQALLTSLYIAAERLAGSGIWPASWAPPPRGVRIQGIELMPRDVGWAHVALGSAAEIVCGDMREVPFPASDVVVVLDSLQYLAIDDQERVLARIRAALGDDGREGRLLLRISDPSWTLRFLTTQFVDRIVTRWRGHAVAPTFCRPVAAWQRKLVDLGFEVEARPMSRGTPFANVLLVARVAARPLVASPLVAPQPLACGPIPR
jgi:SAM-dependent methyltransferase